MTGQTILIIRHAEKPEPGGDGGVDIAGIPDAKSLTPRGWQRAGAWVQLFAPALLAQRSVLPTPSSIFASAPLDKREIERDDRGSRSRRPLDTVVSLASKIGVRIDQTFSKGQEVALAAAISSLHGVVLVCWQHESIVTIANALTPTPRGIPTEWTDDRFNVIFRFDRSSDASAWIFQQIVPVMLDGDSAREIS